MQADFMETDATKPYVEWATKNGFAVIDVNIPSHITNEGVRTCSPIYKATLELTIKKDTSGYVEPDSVDLRAATTRELATYLWENYIEYVSESVVYFFSLTFPPGSTIPPISSSWASALHTPEWSGF